MSDQRTFNSVASASLGYAEGATALLWNSVLLDQHANVHASALASGETMRFSYEDLVCGGLADEQMRLRPLDGQNSLAWLVWHMTRCEDVAINIAVNGGRQVLDDQWQSRLRIDRADIGTGMTPKEVKAFSERVDLLALRDYRLEVGRRTRRVLTEIDDAALDEPIHDTDRWAAAVLGAHGGWVAGVWRRWRRQDFFFLASGHCYQHWGEAITVRSLGGFPVGL